ncbi:integral membrane sensor signal transduction histidine kinase [Chthoniobacter flavus Ellin428]|uniref:histidine kinase n=1 Tax=Chthoniobacter flavus Ellin428 TaxID=497964 RepID=B4CYX7_9BACT|nr:ATP-binding protein [Chthoniobacter flavus]EDY20668.1 integral membrane sensor signal transduction histidine kinase [Chthoniobacter flavus Ellin428]TCO89569.1 two-component system OmpR family sensor kinase/two-component system heavy metal sensor histidine kinase CusS [Chthoniobacter flavus]
MMRSLGSRLTYWYVLVVSVTVIVALLVGWWMLRRQLIHGMDLLNAAEFEELSNRLVGKNKHDPDAEGMRRIAAHSKIDAPLYFFQLSKSGGEVIFRSANMGEAVLPPNPPGVVNVSRNVPLLKDMRISEFPLGKMRMQIAASMRDERHLLGGYFQVSLGMLGVVIVLSVFFGYRLSRLALDPVRRIQRTARRISAENMAERISADPGKDEIADLSRLLNEMFDRLEVSFDRLWRFAADASHELKTPLSLIRLQSEKLLLQGNLSGAQQEAVQQQLESITHLDSIIEKLLFLAKSEVGAITLNLKRQSTLALLNSVIEDAQALCDEARVEFQSGELQDCQANFDATLLRQVILNLLTNALNVAPPGGQIRISSTAADGRWRVAIEDTGPGLPADRIEDVFQPFVRVAHGGTGDAPKGTGLGLAICRSIIDLHKGTIRAENRSPGLRVVFEINLAEAALEKAVA